MPETLLLYTCLGEGHGTEWGAASRARRGVGRGFRRVCDRRLAARALGIRTRLCGCLLRRNDRHRPPHLPYALVLARMAEAARPRGVVPGRGRRDVGRDYAPHRGARTVVALGGSGMVALAGARRTARARLGRSRDVGLLQDGLGAASVCRSALPSRGGS